MFIKRGKAIVSTVLSAMFFTVSALTVFAEEKGDFQLISGDKTTESHEIGLGEETTFTIPEATDNFDDFMNTIKDNSCITYNDENSKYQYTAGDDTYDINGFANTVDEEVSDMNGNFTDGEYLTRFSPTHQDAYYTSSPVVNVSQNENKEITVKEASGKTEEDLQGLILHQEYSFRWSRDLQLQKGDDTDSIKVLNVKTGKKYVVVIKENTPAPAPSAPASSPSSDESTDSGSNSSDASEDLPVIELTQAEAERFFQLNQTNSTVSVGSAPVKSTMEGNFTAKSVAGSAIKTPKADINKALGLKENETAKVVTWDVTPTSAPAAYSSLVAGAESVNGEIGPAIQVNIEKTGLYLKDDGTLDGDAYKMTGTVDMVVGIPASFYVPGARYAVSHVLPGGAYEILEDTDDDPLTVSFPVSAGRGAYALVRIF
ncbi:MAG: hypothetical protein IJ683_08265 [Butyrivibrio sp.]|nr:hypothetical protein [Butyrivibrio sp.]MBR1642299.1 hypothetical protein [Butyrivibrio sp.]